MGSGSLVSAPQCNAAAPHAAEEDAMHRKGTEMITQAEVSAALKRFLSHGGIIKQLPAQNFRPSGLVGGDKYQAFESLNDLPALPDTPERLN
jgi:hypothetical protein